MSGCAHRCQRVAEGLVHLIGIACWSESDHEAALALVVLGPPMGVLARLGTGKVAVGGRVGDQVTNRYRGGAATVPGVGLISAKEIWLSVVQKLNCVVTSGCGT